MIKANRVPPLETVETVLLCLEETGPKLFFVLLCFVLLDSPGTLGSERFSGILHWSTWSFRAFTSSISPGTLQSTDRQLHPANHKRALRLHRYRVPVPGSKTVTHAHPVGFKCGLVAEKHCALCLWRLFGAKQKQN